MSKTKWMVVALLIAMPLTATFGADFSALTRSEKALVLHEGTEADRAALKTLSKSGMLEKLVKHCRGSKQLTTKASGYGTFEGFRQRFISACLARDVEQVVNYCELPLRGTELFTDNFEAISSCTQFAKSFDRLFTKQVVQIMMNTSAEKKSNGTIHLGCLLNEYDEDEGMIIESALIFVFKPLRETYKLVEVIPVG